MCKHNRVLTIMKYYHTDISGSFLVKLKIADVYVFI